MSKRIVIDIETSMNHLTIHLAITKNIDNGEIKVWKAASGLWDYIADATSLIGHNIIGFDAPILNRLWKTNTETGQPMVDEGILEQIIKDCDK